MSNVLNRFAYYDQQRECLSVTRDAGKAAGHRGSLWTYIVHGREPSQPPDCRVTLSETVLPTSRRALEGFQTSISPVHNRLAETHRRTPDRKNAFGWQRNS